MATFPKLFRIQSPWQIKQGLFMSGGETPTEVQKSPLDMFREQEISRLTNSEQRDQLAKVMEKMKTDKKSEAQILTTLKPVVDLLYIVQGYEAKYQVASLSKWAEIVADTTLTLEDIRAFTLEVNAIGRAVLVDEIAHGMENNPCIYMKGVNGRINFAESTVEFNVGMTYTVDFGIGEEGVDQAKARLAQMAMRLDHMIPTKTGVNAIHVESLKYGPKDLYRYPDGKFREAGKKVTDRHFPIYHGDTVSIRANQKDTIVATEEETTEDLTKKATEQYLEAKKAEAQARNAEFKESSMARDQEALKRALGEAEGAEALVKGSKVKIPEEMGKLNRAILEADLIHFNNGEQVLSSLKTFSRLNKEKQPMQIMQELIDCKTVRFQEITRSVYNKGPIKLKEEFNVARNDVKVIDYTQAEIAKIMAAHPEYASRTDKNAVSGEIVKEVKARMLANGFEGADVSRFYLYLEELLPTDLVPAEARGKHNLEALKQQVADMKDFYTASQRFMEGVGGLSRNESTEVTYEGYEKDADMEAIEVSARDIFDPTSGFPEIRQSWLESVFGPKQSETLNMMNLDQWAIREDRPAYEAAISGKSGYELLRNSGSTFNENGMEVGNLEAYAKQLETLRREGWEFIQMNKPELAPKYTNDYAQLPLITEKNYDDLSQQDVDLIRYGAIIERTKVYIKSKQDVESYAGAQKAEVISSYPEAVQEMLTAIDAQGKFTAEQLHQIGEKIKEVDLGMLGLLYKQKTLLQEGEVLDVEKTLGMTYTKPITLLETPDGTKVTLGLGVQNNIIKHTFGVHAGLGAETTVGDRVKVGGGVGVATSGESVGVGVNVSVDIDLGKYKTTSIGANAGVDIAGLGFALGINVSRDLNAVVDKKADKIAEEREAHINAGLDRVMASVYFNELTPAQKVEYKNALANLCLREIHNQAVDNLKDIQFLGAGLMVTHIPGTPLTVPIPWVRIGIKGKELIHYSHPDDMPELSTVADARIAEQLREKTGVETKAVYISGKLSLTDEGEKTLSDSMTELLPTGSIETLNAGLARQGVEIQNVDGDLRLKVKRVNGIVNLYTDPASGIESYVKEGYTYINLNRNDHLTLRRVDTYYPMPYFGHTHHVNLYLSNNLGVNGNAIEAGSKDKISWEQSDLDAKQSSARVISRTSESVADANYRTKKEMTDAGIQEGDFLDPKAVEDQQKALQEIQTAMAMEAANTINLAEIQGIADGMIKGMKIDYVKLTTDEAYTKEMIAEGSKRAGRSLNNHEATYLIQELLVLSRAKAPETPMKFAEHVLGWNKVALTNSLIQNGIAPEMAGAIADKIMVKYASTIVTLETSGEVTKNKIPHAGVVNTLIGPKADGRMGEFITGTEGEAVSLVGMANLTQKQLIETFGLTEAEAKAFLGAEMATLAPRDTAKPYEFMHTELGLAVFEASPILFGPEKARQLIALSKMQSSTEITTPEQGATWAEYATLVNTLRTQKTATVNGMILTLDRSTKMGFLEACRNFTTTLHEGLAILLPTSVEGLSTSAIDYLQSVHGVEFYGGGVAGSISIREKNTPPPPEEETPPPDDGSKNPPVLAGTDDRPLQGFNPGGGTDGDSGTAGADW